MYLNFSNLDFDLLYYTILLIYTIISKKFFLLKISLFVKYNKEIDLDFHFYCIK